MSSTLAITTGTSITIWVICALLAAGVAWTRYEKRRTRDKFLRELVAMDPERREKVLSRLPPEIQNDLRQQLMEPFPLSYPLLLWDHADRSVRFEHGSV